MDKRESYFSLLPHNIREILVHCTLDFEKLQEIRLRCNMPIIIEYDNREYFLSKNKIEDSDKVFSTDCVIHIHEKELRQTIDYVSNYSLYAYEEQLRQGFISVRGGHRVGICGEVVISDGKIKTIKNIASINIRAAHEIIGCSDNIIKYLYSGNRTIYNTLIVSPPMFGKTTLLRDIIRNLSNGYTICGGSRIPGLKVGVVDERCELSASYNGIPQNNLGIRSDVLSLASKDNGIMMLIRTMSPEVIAADEIGSKTDSDAIIYSINCGCKMIATIHGDSINDVLLKESMKKLISEKIFRRFIVLQNSNSVRKVQIYNENLNNIGYELC